jgi:predicted SAM-dependent methyltransferase
VKRDSAVYQAAAEFYKGIPPRLNVVLQLRQARIGRELRNPRKRLRLHLGCGARHLDGFINIDMRPTRACDYVTDITRLPCPDGSADRIEAYHVIEHIEHPKAPAAVAEWFRVLAPGGILVLECPEIDEAARRYLQGDLRMLATIYGWQRFPGDTHYYGYNAARIKAMLAAAGFPKVEERPPQDYHVALEPCLRVEATK